MAVDIINRMLKDLVTAHAILGAQPKVTSSERDSLTHARERLVSAVKNVDPALLDKPPGRGEWSVLQVLEHVLQHDRKVEEVLTKGLEHYAEHIEEHTEYIVKIGASPGS